MMHVLTSPQPHGGSDVTAAGPVAGVPVLGFGAILRPVAMPPPVTGHRSVSQGRLVVPLREKLDSYIAQRSGGGMRRKWSSFTLFPFGIGHIR